jgi:hypothetical protein
MEDSKNIRQNKATRNDSPISLVRLYRCLRRVLGGLGGIVGGAKGNYNSDDDGCQSRIDYSRNHLARHFSPIICSIALLFSLSRPVFSASSDSYKTQRIEQIDVSVRELQKGRPVITGVPTYQGGAVFTGSTSFTSAAVFSGGVTTSSGVVVASSMAFTMSASSPTAANTMYADTFPKVLLHFTPGATPVINYQVNVTSVTRISAGRYRINFARPFSSNFYAWSCSGTDNSTNCICAGNEGTASVMVAGSTDIKFYNTAATLTDCSMGATFTAFGRQ